MSRLSESGRIEDSLVRVGSSDAVTKRVQVRHTTVARINLRQRKSSTYIGIPSLEGMTFQPPSLAAGCGMLPLVVPMKLLDLVGRPCPPKGANRSSREGELLF